LSISWHQRLHSASSVDQVLELTRDFLSTWTPTEIARIPVECRPPLVLDPDDIAFCALALVRSQCLDPQGTPELRRMAAFFGTASERISQLMASVSARDNRHWQRSQVR
jgi:hypothetical protein